MAVMKCKMCGGDIQLSEDKTFGVCEFCGSTTTFPKVADEQRLAMFNRGNHFRRIGEFDKAMSIYEALVREDDMDAEAHWCCALCRFGIEYVEDPASHEFLPTCHRASYDSFLEDIDYAAALKYSDGVTRRQYERDAAKIEEVRRGILTTSQNEAPFDVFICYKETDDSGRRTVDSTLAQDIYYQLTEQGRRVFFARITLEDKAGLEYEPYIFSALNSAKVMVVVGTRPEHFNAVWVRNEWSRFLSLMKGDRKKLLLPCYRDMDPYELPDQLAVLQSYDMSKIGFIQDLTRGVAKVLDADRSAAPRQETVIVQEAGSGSAESMLKRGRMALEDKDWDKADSFFEQVLNLDPECGEAYLGKALAAQQASSLDGLVKNHLAMPPNLEGQRLEACPPADILPAAASDIIKWNKGAKYLLPAEYEKLSTASQFDRTYISYTGIYEKRLKAEQDFFAQNRLLARAAGCGGPEMAQKIHNAREAVLGSFAQQLEEARNANAANIAQVTRNYEAFLAQTKGEVDAIVKKATGGVFRNKLYLGLFIGMIWVVFSLISMAANSYYTEIYALLAEADVLAIIFVAVLWMLNRPLTRKGFSVKRHIVVAVSTVLLVCSFFAVGSAVNDMTQSHWLFYDYSQDILITIVGSCIGILSAIVLVVSLRKKERVKRH